MNVNAETNTFILPVTSATTAIRNTISPRMEIFQLLHEDIPLNDFDLPQFFYAPTFITEDFFELDPQDQVLVLNQAMISITYMEGFPAFSGGTPIWSQMPDEPVVMYDAFKEYLEQTENYAIRQLVLIENTHLSISDLQQGYLYYSWFARSKAHDMFHVAAHQKMRERRILSSNERSFLKAEELFKGLDIYFKIPGDDEESGLPRWIEELTPAVAIKFMEVLNKIQRVSLGLSVGGGENAKDEKPDNADTDVLIKTLVAAGRNPTLNSSAESKVSMDMLLNNPETAELAQRLLVQVKNPNLNDI